MSDKTEVPEKEIDPDKLIDPNDGEKAKDGDKPKEAVGQPETPKPNASVENASKPDNGPERSGETKTRDLKETDKVPQIGGSYKEVKQRTKELVDSILHGEAHHMPADSINELAREVGPGIYMDARDHRQTASYGNSKEVREYRAHQQELISKGKFKEAFEMDVKDVQGKFGDKYDGAISEARAYAEAKGMFK